MTAAFPLELSAVIVSLSDGWPRVVVSNDFALPSGPLETRHEKLEQALRSWVTRRSSLSLGYVEQLYTFADKNRADKGRRVVSIGYLALTEDLGAVRSIDWYAFFPWEDRRAQGANALGLLLREHLIAWKNTATETSLRHERQARIDTAFPHHAHDWDEELVLQRYELLWEAGLVEEAPRRVKNKTQPLKPAVSGLAMKGDHRRILATAMARLRAKIKYRPVVFELLPQRFTLLRLQQTVEALAGLHLHKQNFRRLVLSQGLIEETRESMAAGKGRPARLFSFRRAITRARALASPPKLPRKPSDKRGTRRQNKTTL